MSTWSHGKMVDIILTKKTHNEKSVLYLAGDKESAIDLPVSFLL